MVNVENGDQDDVINEAQIEIAKSLAHSNYDEPPENIQKAQAYIRQHGPTISDPFAGGGSIPLETIRLGVNSTASDINPIAVLITKAITELPQAFIDQKPINPVAQRINAEWSGNSGLADDIRWFGNNIREAAYSKLKHLYPDSTLETGSKITTSAWLFFRSMQCINPACGIEMPLTKSFKISSKRNNEYWIKPNIDQSKRKIDYEVRQSDIDVPQAGSVSRTGAICIACSTAIPISTVRKTGQSDGYHDQMIAIVARTGRLRQFLTPDVNQLVAFAKAKPDWTPSGALPIKARSISSQLYGFTNWSDHFNQRQLKFLTTMVELLNISDFDNNGNINELHRFDTLRTYLTLALGRTLDHYSSFNRWDSAIYRSVPVFSRQGIGMIWDYSEINPFAGDAKDWNAQVEWVARVVERLPRSVTNAVAYQADASQYSNDSKKVFITDPPYYDNIHYAASSDFFYVWHRAVLKETYPELFAGILTPKMDELVSNKFLHDDPASHFENRLTVTLQHFRENSDEEFPSSIIYGYKQQDTDPDGTASTGWEKMLTSIIGSGFLITGTWPIRSENPSRPNANKTNSLATSVVIVIRPRSHDAPVASRQEFFDELEIELPIALDRLTRDGHIGPADLPQAAIGPGMEIYSKYSRVETISGEVITVRDALQQINRVIGTYFDREEGALDIPSRFCVDWIRTHGYNEATFGDAENIARAKNLSVSDIADTHNLIKAERGTVQLKPISEYNPDRPYPKDHVLTTWEACMRMAYHLDTTNEDGGAIAGCGEVGRRMAGNLDSVERLARILYNHYDNLNQPRNAYIYNLLVSEWQDIINEVHSTEQGGLRM